MLRTQRSPRLKGKGNGALMRPLTTGAQGRSRGLGQSGHRQHRDSKPTIKEIKMAQGWELRRASPTFKGSAKTGTSCKEARHRKKISVRETKGRVFCRREWLTLPVFAKMVNK